MQLSGRRSRNKTKVGIQVNGSSAKEPNTDVGMVHVLCIQNICLQLCTGKQTGGKLQERGRGIPFHDILVSTFAIFHTLGSCNFLDALRLCASAVTAGT